MRLKFPALVATISLAAACAKPQGPSTVSAVAATNLKGTAVYSVSEPDPRMRRSTPKSRAVPVTINPLAILATVAITAAASAIVAETSPVNDFPNPPTGLGDVAEAEVATLFAEAFEAELKSAPVLTDDKRSFSADATAASSLASYAKSNGAAGAVLNVRLESHEIKPAVQPGNWDYEQTLSAVLTDTDTGKIIASSSCDKTEALGTVEGFKLASLSHAGGDVAAAEQKLAAYRLKLQEIEAAKADTDNDIVGVNDGVEKAPDDPSEGLSTAAQDKAYFDHRATKMATTCAGILATGVIGSS